MRTDPLGRRLLAEFLGTGLLVAAVVGSGIAAAKLSPGDVGSSCSRTPPPLSAPSSRSSWPSGRCRAHTSTPS
jgi:hypothetical protein